MITRLKINGFKSFHRFEMDFAPFTVIAGTNASGKSNLFDALMLLSRLAETDLKTAFSAQRGSAIELFTQYDENSYASEMEFEVDMLLDRTIKDNWGGEETLNHTRLRYRLVIERKTSPLNIDDLYIKAESLEKIKPQDDEWAKKVLPKEMRQLAKSEKSGGTAQPFIRTEDEGNTVAIKIRQDGKQGGKATRANAATQTVLSAINSVDFKHVLATKTEMIHWRFLQFNPEDLREPSKKEIGIQDTMGRSGKHLAATLYRIGQNDPYNLIEISRKLQNFLPNFIEVMAVNDQANNQYLVKLKDKDQKEYSSRVLSEGTLRILALCVLAYDERHTGLLCFEEPENGIHPFKIKDMALLLKDLSTDFSRSKLPLRQVIINTHSPVLVGVTQEWANNPAVGIFYASITNRITDLAQGRAKLAITSIVPVVEDHTELFPNYPKSQLQLTFFEVKKYLATNQHTS
jgi:predicted ATPase